MNYHITVRSRRWSADESYAISAETLAYFKTHDISMDCYFEGCLGDDVSIPKKYDFWSMEKGFKKLKSVERIVFDPLVDYKSYLSFEVKDSSGKVVLDSMQDASIEKIVDDVKLPIPLAFYLDCFAGVAYDEDFEVDGDFDPKKLVFTINEGNGYVSGISSISYDGEEICPDNADMSGKSRSPAVYVPDNVQELAEAEKKDSAPKAKRSLKKVKKVKADEDTISASDFFK